MKKYSTNYCTTKNNFIIEILHQCKKIECESLYSTFCVVQNILQRNNVVRPSDYLINSIEDYSNSLSELTYISKERNEWNSVIKGSSDGNYNPALIFYNEILTKEMKEFSFIRELIIPEVEINEIVEKNNTNFNRRKVDFYLPECKLVIEIDGSQHQVISERKFDISRDRYLKSNGINTLRISTQEIDSYCNGDKNNIISKLNDIYNMCKNNEDINKYKIFLTEHIKKVDTAMIYDSIFRFQMLILELLKYNVLDLYNNRWIFNIKNNDIKFPYEIALKDIYSWIFNIMKLQGIEINDIDFVIREVNDFYSCNEGVNVDFSLLKRYDTLCCKRNVCYIRADYYNDRDYFKVETGELIKYSIDQYGDEESNIDNLKYILKNVFGFKEFNPGQASIIVHALSQNDTVGLLPTGSGKSLCYQLTCLLQPTVNFVVVPLKSLMIDQKENLVNKGITRTNYISSELEGEEKRVVLDEFKNKKYFYLWISPERFQTEEFRKCLKEINGNYNLGYAVIDEVHCLSEWGHDFRTSYLNLVKTIKNICPKMILLGLTATASKNVIEDIKIEFENKYEDFKTVLDYSRPELTFKIIKDNENEDGKYDNLIKLLKNLRVKDYFDLKSSEIKCGLIFTPHIIGKYGCYDIRNNIKSEKKLQIDVDYYSGEVPKIKEKDDYGNKIEMAIMDEKEYDSYKKDVQKKFMNDKISLLVTTKAFGMGIDKRNIRSSIHYGIPGSIESFYQEAGRAGRDKNKAICYILHSKNKKLIEDYEKIFGLNTSVEELNSISNKNNYSYDDVMRNLFLYLQNNKGVNDESKLTYIIYKSICKIKKRKIKVSDIIEVLKFEGIYGVLCNFNSVHKAIYRLSILGVINDWTISWKDVKEFNIYYGDLRENSIKEKLIVFIRKYDNGFRFDKLNTERYKKYNDIYNNENDDEVYKFIKILIQWNYDNIFYNRRQSLKTLIDLCDSYEEKGEVYFKDAIESYFKISNKTSLLDGVLKNTYNVDTIRKLLLNNYEDIKSREEIFNLRNTLPKYLESFRYNPTLNYLSGICGILLGKYNNQEKERFIEAFKDIVDIKERADEFLELTLHIGSKLECEQRNELGEILNIFYNDKKRIYNKLKDNTSLDLILEESINKLTEIGERMNG